MKKLDGRSKKARALKAAAAEGIRKAAEQEALQRIEANLEATQSLLDAIAPPEGGIGARGMYVPLEFNEAPRASAGQIGGDHYVNKAIQPWDAMECWMRPEEFRGYLRGNALKYLARCDDKGGKTDIAKARHYLTKLLEVMPDA